MIAVAAKRTQTKALIPISMRINGKLMERLDAYCQRQGRNRSEVVDRAIEEYLDRRDQQSAEQHKPAHPRR